MTVSHSGKDVAHMEYSYTAGGEMHNGTIWGNILATSYKIKQTVTIWLSNSILLVLIHLCMNVCSYTKL